jgi:aspartate racemase
MKTIGLIGGMSWQSTQEYRRIINEEVNRRLGGQHSAKIAGYDVDFADIEALQHENEWGELTYLMVDAGKRVKAAGADFIVIATNTMHKMADDVQHYTNLPVLHICDATAGQIANDGISIVGLLGTRFTMEQNFYRGRLQKAGLGVAIPDTAERELVHRVIYEELCKGKIEPDSRKRFQFIIDSLREQGARGVVLGCTEIPLLIQQVDIPYMKVYDTTDIHAKAAVDYALADGKA